MSRDVTTPLQGRFVVRRLGLATITLYTKYEVSMLNAKIGVFWWVRGHPRSSETSPFDRGHMTSYSTLIEIYVYLLPFSSYSAFFVESDQF